MGFFFRRPRKVRTGAHNKGTNLEEGCAPDIQTVEGFELPRALESRAKRAGARSAPGCYIIGDYSGAVWGLG